MSTRFTVHGPFPVPVNGSGQQRKVPRGCKRFWEEDCVELEERRGCYVFGIRWGQALVPTYIGLTTKQDFGRECFTPHKVKHYNKVLAARTNGAPVMLLIVAPDETKVPKLRIADLETFLIQTAVAAGRDLTNQRKRGKRDWSINGVVRSPDGRPSSGARVLKAALGLG